MDNEFVKGQNRNKRPIQRYKRLEKNLYLFDFRLIKRPVEYFGRNGGMPRKTISPEWLSSKCNEYFASCFGVTYDRFGKPIKDDNGEYVLSQNVPYTISGLAYHLGLSTSSLKRYCSGDYDEYGFDIQEEEQFSYILNRARQKIESYAERRLYDKDGTAGAKFVLDVAFGWITHKELAEIQNMRLLSDIKKQEIDLKRELAALDEDRVDSEFIINVVRAEREDD